MIENRENYIFKEDENVVVKVFETYKDGIKIAGGFVGISDEELLKLYEANHELAMMDYRLPSLLEPSAPVEPEPTQLDRIESLVAKSQEEIAQEARDAYTLELIEGGVIA